MIGKLRGKIDAIGESIVILDVNGVGYEVQCSARTLRNMAVGDEVSLTIDTHVREDAIKLFGFSSEIERSWFRTLQTVQGVGAKVALGVLGVMKPAELATAISLGDWSAIKQAPGVGKTVAEKIIVGLKNKIPALPAGSIALPTGSVTGGTYVPPEGNAAAEAISALANLGYNPGQASGAVAIALKDLGETADTAKLIRRSLKELSR